MERGIKTLKDYMRGNLWDVCTINEALSRSINVMRTTVHSSTKEAPFERQYGQIPITELLYLSTNVKFNVVSATLETLKVYTSSNNEGHHDQLVMEAPQQTHRER